MLYSQTQQSLTSFYMRIQIRQKTLAYLSNHKRHRCETASNRTTCRVNSRALGRIVGSRRGTPSWVCRYSWRRSSPKTASNSCNCTLVQNSPEILRSIAVRTLQLRLGLRCLGPLDTPVCMSLLCIRPHILILENYFKSYYSIRRKVVLL